MDNIKNQGPSTMPYVMVIVVLLLTIVGITVYFMMFHKPSLEKCSNLYQSNICTSSYCTSKFPCKPVEWKPEIESDKDNFLGWKFKYLKDGTGITSVISDYDSKACKYLKDKNLDVYSAGPGEAVGDLKCEDILGDIDNDIEDAKDDWMLKSNLLKVRRVINGKCALEDTIPSSAFKEGGDVANAFCKPK
jgi:hypothetical protein